MANDSRPEYHPPVLRQYQAEAVAAIRAAFGRRRRVLFVLPTGGGKTICFAYITLHAAAKGNRVIVLAHRQEIADQISAALTAMGVAHGRIQPGHPITDDLVQVAMVQTLARRLEGIAPPALLVVDEAHHAVAGTWTKIAAAWPNTKILGVTATPERLDGVGLGDAFDEIVLGPDVRELINAGHLAPFRYLAPSIEGLVCRSRGGPATRRRSEPETRCGMSVSDPTPIRLGLLNEGYQPTPICSPGCNHVDRHGKPCKSGGKAVHISAWTKGGFTAGDVRSWHRSRPQDTNTGILCGEMVGVDTDILDPALAAQADALAEHHLGPTPLRRIGRAPKWLRCYRVETPLPKLETPERRLNGETIQVEIMGQGQQVAAYGTHPVTMQPYM